MKNKTLTILSILFFTQASYVFASEITGTFSAGGSLTTGLTGSVVGGNTGGGSIGGTVVDSGSSEGGSAGGGGGGGGSPSVTPIKTSVVADGTTNTAAPGVITTTVLTFTKELKSGASDNEVKDLQKFLNANGYVITASGAGSKGKENNTFGALTKAALIKFQKANKLAQSGYLDAATKSLLNKLVGTKTVVTQTVPAITSAVSFTKDLQLGSSGNEVKKLQEILIKKATGPQAKLLSSVGANGNFGNMTKAALIEFQKAKGISPASGNFGPKTRAVIGL